MRTRMLGLAVIGALGFCLAAQSADAVSPISITFTNKRDEAVQTLAGRTVYQGVSLCFTNCKMYADSGGSTPQGLDGCTVRVSVGTLATNIDYTATVLSAPNGTWWRTVTVPALSTFNIQVKVTDSNTNSYIYANKVLSANPSQF